MLSEAAKQTGLTPDELVKKLVMQHFPLVPDADEDDIDAKLRSWQERDGTKLSSDIPTQTLFDQWAEEDAQMTDDERKEEDRLWEDIEKGLTENSLRLQLRRIV